MKLIKTKHFRQRPNFCGPASLKILLSFYGVEQSEAQLGKLSGCDNKIGTHHEGMVKAARALGFKVNVKKDATLGELGKLVKRDTPVIVGWFSEWTDHYSVVIGLDDKYVYLDNPEEEKPVQKVERWKFKHLWFDFVGKKNDRVCRGWMMWVE